MKQKIVMTECKGRRLTALFEGNSLAELHYSSDKKKSYRLGEIYIGKVKKILANGKGAFVEIGKGMECYYSLEDRYEPIFTNKPSKKALAVGDEMIVQVQTEAVKTKQPTVTGNLNFAGKYVVITSGNQKAGVSSKLSKKKREELLEWWEHQEHSFAEPFGIIFRTNAGEASYEQLDTDIERLYQEYEHVMRYGKMRTCYSCLKKAEDSAISVLRGVPGETLEEIVVDAICENGELLGEVKAFLEAEQPEDLPLLRSYEDDRYPLAKCYNLERETEQALKERVWMKSGAYLVIQPTEALTVIDVNSGKCQKRENALLKVNYEAAKEAARQIRLRNLSGIILIDFINMEKEEEKEELMHVLQKELNRDTNPGKVVDMTRLQLVEITRKKVKKTLAESLQDEF